MKRIIAAAVLATAAVAANAGSINDLQPGMTVEQIKELLGNPDSTQFHGGKWILKYTEFKPFKGKVPYYLIVDKETKQLEEWTANMEELAADQQRVMGVARHLQRDNAIRAMNRPQPIGPTRIEQKIEADVTVKVKP